MKLTVYNLVWKMYYSSRRRLYQWKTKICNNWYKTLCSTLFSTLSAQDNEKLFQQLKKGFKRTINLNKYQSEPKNIYTKPISKSLNWYKFSGSKWTFCFVIWEWWTSKKLQAKFQGFKKFFQMVHLLIQNYQKLNCIK